LPKSQTQIFKYFEVFQASAPPDDIYLTPSFDQLTPLKVPGEKLVCFVAVLVMPDVLFPFGSFVARQNSISQSAATAAKTEGIAEVSAFNLL
jgi:hypothetical protein